MCEFGLVARVSMSDDGTDKTVSCCSISLANRTPRSLIRARLRALSPTNESSSCELWEIAVGNGKGQSRLRCPARRRRPVPSRATFARSLPIRQRPRGPVETPERLRLARESRRPTCRPPHPVLRLPTPLASPSSAITFSLAGWKGADALGPCPDCSSRLLPLHRLARRLDDDDSSSVFHSHSRLLA